MHDRGHYRTVSRPRKKRVNFIIATRTISPRTMFENFRKIIIIDAKMIKIVPQININYLHQNHVFSCAAISTISHKVKAWSFSNLNYANPQPIPLRADTGCFRPPNIDGNVCFLVLHVSRKDGRSASKGASEVRSFAEQASELITPRGLRIPVGEKFKKHFKF